MCNLEKLFVFSLGAAVYINYWSLAYLDHHYNSTLLSLMRFFFLLSHTHRLIILYTHTYICICIFLKLFLWIFFTKLVFLWCSNRVACVVAQCRRLFITSILLRYRVATTYVNCIIIYTYLTLSEFICSRNMVYFVTLFIFCCQNNNLV